jgi:acyl-CoA thioester hydrolase
MARVEVELPSPVLFTTEIAIRIGDVNYGGHLGNDAVLALAHEARVRFLAAHGWGELDLDGVGLLMVDAALVYRAEGKYGMVLRAEVGAADVRTRGCDLVHRFSDAATGTEIARAKTGLVFRDPATGKLVRMPERLQRLLAPAR